MKINSKILSIPPYISTTWSNVSAIYLKDSELIINLHRGETVSISGLPSQLIENIFSSHMAFLEKDQEYHLQSAPEKLKDSNNLNIGSSEGDASFKVGIGFLEGMGAAMQHNPSQMNTPDLPKQILDKIGTIAKIIPTEDIQNLPKPEPHCNCPHCQIARALTQHFDQTITPVQIAGQIEQVDEEVSDEDLTFQQWEISQSGDKLYNVTNRLDTKERYSVYLGHPVGCTCGKTGCEHILAVLKS